MAQMRIGLLFGLLAATPAATFALEHATVTVDGAGTPSISHGSPGFFLDAGSATGEYPVRIGASAADDASGGVLVSAVSEIVRGTQYATGSTIPDGNLLSSNTRATAGGLAISATAEGPTDPVTGGTPTNSNLSAGYFPFANGWLGGTVSSSTANADRSFGTLDTLVASGGIALGTNVQPDFDA
ncbi:MAG: hypothetical protein AAF266_00475, partial [Planctomycetota bacterium]